jgi:xanthine dehydrogenase accessory factor
MDERMFARLAERLAREALVLASVIDTRGATPRKRGSRMLVSSCDSEFSIGGGAAEARVIDAARSLLHSGERSAQLAIDLTGHADAAGVCGGTMRLSLRRWDRHDQERAAEISKSLARGVGVVLSASDIGRADGVDLIAMPDPRLLIVGAGHCGSALYDLATHLDFDLWLFDPRPECLEPRRYPRATLRCGDSRGLVDAFDGNRPVFAVLLNRDFGSDVETLRALDGHRTAFLGMMGSRRRIAQVRAALPELDPEIWTTMHAPIGLPIDAETPHEIAVSILAQLLLVRRHLERTSIDD